MLHVGGVVGRQRFCEKGVREEIMSKCIRIFYHCTSRCILKERTGRRRLLGEGRESGLPAVDDSQYGKEEEFYTATTTTRRRRRSETQDVLLAFTFMVIYKPY